MEKRNGPVVAVESSLGRLRVLRVADGVEVWLATEPGPAANLVPYVSDEDVQQAAPMRGPAAAALLWRRAMTRLVLARHMRCEPAAVAIDRRCEHCGHPRHGRPNVAGGPAFSVSSAGSTCVVAVSTTCDRIGVDVASRSSSRSAEAADAFLHPAEAVSLVASGPALHNDLLVRLWADKEAVLKLLGTGLAIDPRALLVTETATGGGLVRLPHDGGACPAELVRLSDGDVLISIARFVQ